MSPNPRPCLMVTGAGGALARAVIERLRADHRLVAVDFRRRVDLGPDLPSYFVRLSERGLEDVFRQHEIRGVIHLGRIGEDESNRFTRYNANVLGTRRLLELCLKYGVTRSLILSTFHVYGAHAYNPALLDETAPLKASELTKNLVDGVELDNLAQIYLWRYPELRMTLLRPCHIVGPGVRNSMSRLLSSRVAPMLLGFSPMMQFIHVHDMADAVARTVRADHPGIYNVAPDDWIAYGDALLASGCAPVPLPSIPPSLPRLLARNLTPDRFPSFLLNYFKYPVVIDGALFRETFGFQATRSLDEIFAFYRAGRR
jgi:UDP-glucose 4-epimerase